MKNIFKKRLLLVTALLVMTFLIGGCGSSETDKKEAEQEISKPIELRMVSALATNTINGHMADTFAKVVNEKSGGKVKIKLLGGPEVIPSFELAEAVKSGSVDVAYIPGGYYQSAIPELEVLTYTNYTVDELRQNGAWDYLNKLHKEKANLYLLHSMTHGIEYKIFTKKKINSIQDLKGYKLRVAPSMIAFAKAAGADIINLPLGDIPSAMEKGIVDGFSFVSVGVTDYGFQNLISQVVVPGIAKTDMSIIFNNDVWEKIPSDLQKSFLEWAKEAATNETQYVATKYQNEQKELEKLGIAEVDLGEELSKMAVDAGWGHIKEKTSPDTYEKLRELFVKK